MSARSRRRQGEPTLPLINIVFLMLIFFLVTAQTARPLDPELELVRTDDDTLVPPPDAIVLHASGDVTFRGRSADAENIVALLKADGIGQARLLPDRRATAREVLSLAAALRTAGAEAVLIVTEQAL